MSNPLSIHDLQVELRNFAKERDWEQFHTPKNLAMALIVEVAELLEHYQWLTPEESHNLDEKKLRQVDEELGDIQIYLVRMADLLGIDILDAATRKLEKNRRKYPAEKVRGSARKYTEYTDE